MKTRVLTGIVGASLAVGILYFYDTYFLNIVLAAISCLCMFEVLRATGYQRKIPVLLGNLLFSALIPLTFYEPLMGSAKVLCYLYIVAMFLLLIYFHESLDLSKMGIMLLMNPLISFGLSTLIFMRDGFREDGLFYIVLALGGAWVTDAGAYFAGTLFGKRKLIEKISPKKTVEGVIGGLIAGLLFVLLIGWGYQALFLKETGTVRWFWLILISIAVSLVGMLGDLSASLIKRAMKIKDFGHILPGHGGMMDRFDSVLFAAPFIYLMIGFFPIIYR